MEEKEKEIIIKINSLQKTFATLKVLKDVSLEIEKGEVVAILGPSGSGKSTLIRCINLLEYPTGGEVIVEGQRITGKISKKDLNKLCLKVGMVFQHFNLFPHMTVSENIMFAPKKILKMNKKEALELARELLDKVGLADKADVYPNKLSGGQKQRVAIARALAMKPDILLFDEPTSALDPEMVKEVLDVMKGLAKSGITMLVVTHEMGFARQVANRICFIDDGEAVMFNDPEDFFENNKLERANRFLSNVF